ncbi:MAG: hypothetical protein ABSA30_08350 [Candidatus Aminicenantales bacterium]|jgi:hypothetical protein
MKNPGGIMTAAVLGSALSVFCLAGIAGDKISDNAKMYQADLEAMKGQESPKILAKLAEWKFELTGRWMTENPASKDFGEHNQGKTKFSKKEAAEIFAQAGKYTIAIYSQEVGTDSATVGTINFDGTSKGMDSTINLTIYTVIRAVFNEDKLISVRTWPKLESSNYVGGNRWIR